MHEAIITTIPPLLQASHPTVAGELRLFTNQEVAMPILFDNRVDAGRWLGRRLHYLAKRPHLLVLGLPRGGVPVAYQVAAALGAPLDIFVVRKLGIPGHEELAMGAIASGGIQVLNQDTVQRLRIAPDVIETVAARERQELDRRERAYRGYLPRPSLHEATVILVDDGVATGSTMRAAVRAIRQQRPAFLVVAAPVMSREAATLLRQEADACETLAIPEPFYGVGQWYGDFSQTTDAEVIQLLEAAAARPESHVTIP
jgi:predicted phosphoribosyltransferase